MIGAKMIMINQASRLASARAFSVLAASPMSTSFSVAAAGAVVAGAAPSSAAASASASASTSASGFAGAGAWSGSSSHSFLLSAAGLFVGAAAAAGMSFSDDDAVHCAGNTPGTGLSWGWGQYGQLGLGAEKDVPIPTEIESLKKHGVKSLRSSGFCTTTAAVAGDDTLYTFGCGMDGRLGHGSSIDAPNQDNPRRVERLPPNSVMSVAVGEAHMAVLLKDGQVWSFGKNRAGQLGHKDPAPGFPSAVDSLKGANIVKVACGRQHTVALSATGEVYTWGYAYDGALGHDTKDPQRTPKKVEALEGMKIIEVACGRSFTLFLTDKGEVYACGIDDMGQLGQGFASKYQRVPVQLTCLSHVKVSKIIAGEHHALAITDSGAVYTWGCGSHGQLGHGNRENLGIARQVEALADQVVVDGAAGGAHSLILTKDNKVFAWGRGRNGQLGRGNHLESIAAYRTEPLQIDAIPAGEVLELSAGDSHSLAVVSRK